MLSLDATKKDNETEHQESRGKVHGKELTSMLPPPVRCQNCDDVVSAPQLSFFSLLTLSCTYWVCPFNSLISASGKAICKSDMENM